MYSIGLDGVLQALLGMHFVCISLGGCRLLCRLRTSSCLYYKIILLLYNTCTISSATTHRLFRFSPSKYLWRLISPVSRRCVAWVYCTVQCVINFNGMRIPMRESRFEENMLHLAIGSSSHCSICQASINPRDIEPSTKSEPSKMIQPRLYYYFVDLCWVN